MVIMDHLLLVAVVEVKEVLEATLLLLKLDMVDRALVG